jgi:superfamily II DNA or RNA helicase
MSIKYPIDDLTDDMKSCVLQDLEFENPNTKQWIYSFHIDEENKEIYLPYAYARKRLKIKPPERDIYPSVDMNFLGNLRPYQKVVRKQALKQLNKKGSCLLSLHVGWGKSILSVYLATKLGFKTLIVLNKLMLVNQWIEEIHKNTNVKCQYIKSKQKMDPDCDFYIMNAINIPKMGTDFFKTIGTVLVDETHLIMAEKMFKAMFQLTPRYIIALSATPYRPDGLNVLLDTYFGEEKIVEKLNKPHTVYTVHTGIKINYELQWDGKMNWNSVLTNQAENPERNKLIIDIISKFNERSFLVLCKRISQGKELMRLLQENGESVTDLLGSKRDFDPEARIVVATTQKCGVGFSHNKLNTLLLASDMQEYFIQYLGRVFRTPDTEPMVFDLVDDLPILNRHYKTRQKVYKESGGKIQHISNILLL